VHQPRRSAAAPRWARGSASLAPTVEGGHRDGGYPAPRDNQSRETRGNWTTCCRRNISFYDIAFSAPRLAISSPVAPPVPSAGPGPGPGGVEQAGLVGREVGRDASLRAASTPEAADRRIEPAAPPRPPTALPTRPAAARDSWCSESQTSMLRPVERSSKEPCAPKSRSPRPSTWLEGPGDRPAHTGAGAGHHHNPSCHPDFPRIRRRSARGPARSGHRLVTGPRPLVVGE
jgi:hypothetical protein